METAISNRVGIYCSIGNHMELEGKSTSLHHYSVKLEGKDNDDGVKT